MKIVIVDYGMGNIRSIISTLNHLGIEDVQLGVELEKLAEADKLILPGVGSFGKAIEEIKKRNLDQILKDVVLEQKKPILGICLGMQLMGSSSTEDGLNQGLGFVNGVVTKFDSDKVKVPHVGFNQVEIDTRLKLYQGFTTKNPDFYFTHSYRMHSSEAINACFCEYENTFIASFEQGHIAGTQFHPELSQTHGLKVLKNFINEF